MSRRFRLTCLVVGTLAAVAVLSMRARASVAAPTREALASGFDAGVRNLVIEWDPDDPRSGAERRAALFDFMYETYDASAWIPQSLFDTNVLTQAVVGDVDTIVRDKVGLVLWRDNPRVTAFGMAPNAGTAGHGAGAAFVPLKWTVNCLVCHMAEIDGVAYFGAGTKTFDEFWLGEALRRLTSDASLTRLTRGAADDLAARDAHRILNAHHHD